MEMVKRLGSEDPVVIFSKSSCCISYTVKTLICSFGANPTVYELDEVANGEELEKGLTELGRQPTVPAVFIGKKLVGGSKEVMSLNVKGKLKPMLIEAKAIWV
ncbi:Monothiol glutaredoxin-S1 [Heracleum sosnowskyi]|uniref:Monothiol glutaredoxin-S1 n=1 Tax=Heracleum sosnowskyi TaxID=360622 RepID=A0AAD8IAA8_9APIA|nr:Monothiol glutaredoxin-S1 [Heracleum sosnowskyi]